MTETKRRSLVDVIRGLPQLFLTLVKAELNQLKKELTAKVINAAVGIGLFVAALAILALVLPVLIAAAILGFATIVPPWLAALIVAGIMLVVVAGLVFFGIRYFKRIGSAVPQKTVDSVKSDIDAVKGMGDYDK